MSKPRIFRLERATGRSGPLSNEDAAQLQAVFAQVGIGDLVTIRNNNGSLFATMDWLRGTFERSRVLTTGPDGVVPLVRVMRDHFKKPDFVLSGRRTSSRGDWVISGWPGTETSEEHVSYEEAGYQFPSGRVNTM